jgi:predicted dienelactone hydrolase
VHADSLRVRGHAAIGAAPLPSAAPRPAVVFAPGGSSFAELSTSLAEHLASHGYVVVLVQPNVQDENGDENGTTPPDPAAAALTTEALRLARQRQLAAAVDLLSEPFTSKLVGPIDVQRVAVGGHSYGGSAAFNASLLDPRVRAVFDLDGMFFEEAAKTPTTVPSLVVMATMLTVLQTPEVTGEPPDVQQARATLRFLRTAPRVVAIGLVGAEHYDVTDVPFVAPLIPAAVSPSVGAIGRAGTTHTNTIVLRFLDAALGSTSRLPTATELGAGLASATQVKL